MERGGNEAAVAPLVEMPTTLTSSTPVLARALASYVIPSSSTGIMWPSMLRPGVTRPSRSRSLSAGFQLHRCWSVSVAPRRDRDRIGGSSRSAFYEEEEEEEDGETLVDADAALDALEADARAWPTTAAAGDVGEELEDSDLPASLLMLPREIIRSLLVEEAGCSFAGGGATATPLLTSPPPPTLPPLPSPPPPVAAARCRHGRSDVLCLRPAGEIGQEVEVIVFRFARRRQKGSGGEQRREKVGHKNKRGGGEDDDDDSAGSWPSDGASSSSEEEEEEEEQHSDGDEDDEGDDEGQVPTCLQTLRLPSVGLPLSRAAAAAASVASSSSSSSGGDDESNPRVFFAVAASHWLSLHSLGLQEPSYYGAAGRTWGSIGAFAERRGEEEAAGGGTTVAAAALALQAAERISAVALSASSSSSSADSSSSPVRLAFATERGGAIYEALPFASGSAAAPLRLPPFPSSSSSSSLRPLAARLVAEKSPYPSPLSCGCASVPWSPPCPHSHLSWLYSHPHSLLSAQGRGFSLIDLRARPRSSSPSSAAAAATLLPRGGLVTALCSAPPSPPSSHLFAVATDAKDVLLYDKRRPAAPLASWRLREGSGGGGLGEGSGGGVGGGNAATPLITTLSISLSSSSRYRSSTSSTASKKGSVLAIDSRGNVTCCSFERGARTSRLWPDERGGGVCVVGNNTGERRGKPSRSSPSSFSWRALSAVATKAAPPRELIDLRKSEPPPSRGRCCGSAVVAAAAASRFGSASTSSDPSLLLFRCEGAGGGVRRARGSMLLDSLSPSCSSRKGGGGGGGEGTTAVASLDLPASAAVAAVREAARKRERAAKAPASSRRVRADFRPCVPPYDARPVAELLTAALESWERGRRGRGRQGNDGDGDGRGGGGGGGEWRVPPPSGSDLPRSSFQVSVPSLYEDGDADRRGGGGVSERLAARLLALAAAAAGEEEGARRRQQQQQRPPPPPVPLPPPPPSRHSRSVERLLAAWPD